MGNGFRLAVYDYFLGLVALGVVYIFKMISELSRPSQKEETALDILKRDTRKGEVTREEFEKMGDELKKG